MNSLSLLTQIRNKTLKSKLNAAQKNALFEEFKVFVDTFKLSEYVQYSNKDLLNDEKNKTINEAHKDMQFLSEVAYAVLETNIKDNLINSSLVHQTINQNIRLSQKFEESNKLYFDYNWVQQVFDIGGVFSTPAKSVYSILLEWFPNEDKMSLFYYYLYLRFDLETIKSIQVSYAFSKYRDHLTKNS